MEWLQTIVNLVSIFCLGLYIKSYFPSYMKEKGKNLATREDIQEITHKTEEVQKEFREGFELFSSDLQFKYDFYFKQYSELYSKLYAIIIQSEYVRRYMFLKSGIEHSFEKIPFIEISYNEIKLQDLLGVENQAVKEIKKPISEFNKKNLCEYIIDNGEYATQKLLKLAVAYRYAYSHYAGNKETTNYEEIANVEEIRLIREMVCCIVSEYNYFRKELKMNYNEEELDKGIPLLEEN